MWKDKVYFWQWWHAVSLPTHIHPPPVRRQAQFCPLSHVSIKYSLMVWCRGRKDEAADRSGRILSSSAKWLALVDVVPPSDQNASGVAPLPGMSIWAKASGRAQDSLKGLHFLGLEAPPNPPTQPGISSKKLLVRRRPGTPCLRLLPLQLILGWVEENGWMTHSVTSSYGLSVTGLSLHSLSCVILVVTSKCLMENSKQKLELRTETFFDSLEWCLYKRTNSW